MKQVRMGIIGVGGRGGIAVHWHKPGGTSVVVAGADVSPKNLETFREKYGNVFTTTDYRELLKRKDIDAVAITSPDWTHEEYAIAALKAGKHVYCEKPIAITIAGCDRILLAAKKSGKKFMVGFNMRYMSVFPVMKDIIEKGVIGEVKAVWVRHFVGLGGQFYYHDWHANSKNSTGLLLQKGSHDIDMIHYLTGKYTKKVSAFGSLDYFGGNKPNDLRCKNCKEKDTCWEFVKSETMDQCCFRKEVDVEDNNIVIMELEGGIKASYLQCHFTPEYLRNYVIIGTEGRVECVNEEKVVIKMRPGVKLVKNSTDKELTLKPVEGGHGGADPVICGDFIDYVLTGKKPKTTPVAGRQSVAVGCLGTESIRKGGKVLAVPPLPKGIKE